MWNFSCLVRLALESIINIQNCTESWQSGMISALKSFETLRTRKSSVNINTVFKEILEKIVNRFPIPELDTYLPYLFNKFLLFDLLLKLWLSTCSDRASLSQLASLLL